MSARKWTPEQKQRQSEAIKRWKPWEESTGPTSSKGKAVVARNALAGERILELRRWIQTIKQTLREQGDWLK